MSQSTLADPIFKKVYGMVNNLGRGAMEKEVVREAQRFKISEQLWSL